MGQDDTAQLAAAEHLISRFVAEGATLCVSVTAVLELDWVSRSGLAGVGPATIKQLFAIA